MDERLVGRRYLIDNGNKPKTFTEVVVLEVSNTASAIKLRDEKGIVSWRLTGDFKFETNVVEELPSDSHLIVKKQSKVEWQSHPLTKFKTWKEAKDYADSLGGGWRLPTINDFEDVFYDSTKGFPVFEYYWISNGQTCLSLCYAYRNYKHTETVQIDERGKTIQKSIFYDPIIPEETEDYSEEDTFVRCVRDLK
jgi:hypothetical protein